VRPRPCRQRIAVAALAAALLAPGPAGASERSEILTARGLAKLGAGDHAGAIGLFNEAVAADSEDVHALYFRAVTRGRQKDLDGAAADLRAALAVKPDFAAAALELGVVLIDAGDEEGAIAPLEAARRDNALEARASFLLGFARLRTGDLAAAGADFSRAAELDAELRVPAEYYAGVAAYKSGNWPDAEVRFNSVVRQSPGSELGRNAEDFLARMTGRAVAQADRPYELHAETGFEYDSNVPLAPDGNQDALGVTDEGDGRFVIAAGGRYFPYQGRGMTFSLGYDFFQSLHFDLTDFNLQDHRPAADFTYSRGPLHAGVAARYDYYLRKTDGFLSQFTGVPWIAYDEGNLGRAEAFYRFRSQDYQEDPFDVLNGINNSIGVRQIFFLGSPARTLSLGYRFDKQDSSKSSGKAFEYDGHELGVGLGADLPAAISGQAFYAYRFEDYAGASDGRKDHEHQIVLSAERPLTDLLGVRLAYFGTFNDSNQSVFQYDRNVVSFSVWVRY
jgi:Tfp pilus assembly protein PilF